MDWFGNPRSWPPGPRGDWIALAVVVVVSFALIWLSRGEPGGKDDVRDFIAVDRILHGHAVMSSYSQMHYRLGWAAQIAAAQKSLGYSIAAYYAVAMSHSLFAVAGVFWLVRLFYPLAAAVLAALALATNPYFLTAGSRMVVDWPVTGWFLAGAACAVLAARSESGLRDSTRLGFAVLAGALLWMGWWTKQSVLPLIAVLPGVLLVVRRDRTTWTAAGLAIAAFVALLGVELWLNHWVLGDALKPYSRVASAYRPEYAGRILSWGGDMREDLTWADLVLRYPLLFWRLAPGMAFLGLAALGLAAALITKQRPLLLFAAFATVSWAAISLAVCSYHPLVPVLRTKFRYVASPFAFFIVLGVCGGYVLWNEWMNRAPRAWHRAIRAGGLLCAALFLAFQLAYQLDRPVGYSFVSRGSWKGRWLLSDVTRIAVTGVDHGKLQVRRIVADHKNMGTIRMFAAGRRHIGLKVYNMGKPMTPGDFRKGDLVYVDRAKLSSIQRLREFRAQRKKTESRSNSWPPYLLDPPGEWRSVWPSSFGEKNSRDDSKEHRLYYVISDPAG